MKYANRLVSIFATIACLAGCAPKNPHHPIVQIDPAFESYVDRFVGLSVVNGGPTRIEDLVIQFRPLDGLIANCRTDDGETPVISVDPAVWRALNETDQQNVIFHEMGHCVLRRLHQDSIIAGFLGIGIQDSLMSTSLLPTATFLANQAYFEHELFQVANQY